MATARVVPHGKKMRVRWREGGGTGPWRYIPFELDQEAKAATAVDIINRVGCRISKETVIAALNNTSVEHVLALKAQRDARRPRPAGKIPTVAEGVQPYFDFLRNKEDGTQEDTIEKYHQLLKDLWLRRIGTRRFDEVTPRDIEEGMTELRTCTCTSRELGYWCKRARTVRDPRVRHSGGLAKKTRDRYFSVIRGLFNYAEDEGWLTGPSPVDKANYKQQSLSRYNEQKKEEKHFYLTKEQFALVRSKMRPQTQVMLNVVGETGLRFSEVTALQKKKFVRQPKPQILVTEAFKKLKRREGLNPGERILGTPKGGKTDALIISSILALQLDELVKGKNADDFIFTTVTGRLINASNFYRDEWLPAIRAAMRCPEHPPPAQVRETWNEEDLLGPRCGDNGGRNAKGKPCSAKIIVGTNRCYAHTGVARDAVSDCECTDPKNPRRLPRKLSPHDLRHTYAAWMIALDENPLAIADRMRHGVEVFGKVYAGLLDEVRDRLAAKSTIDF